MSAASLTGSVQEGIDVVNGALEAVPDLGFGYDLLWFGYSELGRYNEALDAAKAHFGITMGNQPAVEALERGFQAAGFQGAMLEAAETLAERSETSYVPAFEIAVLYELGGDVDSCFEWLNIAYDQHDPTLPYIAAVPVFESISNDSRYADLLGRMNLSQWLQD